MKATFFSGAFAALLSVAAAWTQPTGKNVGNPIRQPDLTHPITAGKPFTITWDATSQGTVTLLFLKGPSTNVIPQFAIAEQIANSGSYTWQVPSDIAAGESGYGLQIIVDATGDYQYSTQFGVINDGKVSSSAVSSSTAASSSSVAPPAGTGYASGAGTKAVTSGSVVYETSYETKTDCSCTSTGVVTPAAPTGTATGYIPNANGTVSVPTYTAPSPSAPVYTGAASSVKVGSLSLALVAGVAVALF